MLGGGARLLRARSCEPCSRPLCAQKPQATFGAGWPGDAVVHAAQTVVAARATAFIILEGQAARQRVHTPAAGRDLRQRLLP